MPQAAIVYFVDVAQGSSQVVLFPDSSIVVIDCGESADALITLLDSISFSRIRAFVVSHWHKDHVGGAQALMDSYADKIDHVFFSQDQAANRVLACPDYNDVFKASDDKKNFSMEILQCRGSVQGRLLDTKHGDSDAYLEVLYPDGDESLRAQQQQDENQGSGVLALRCGNSRILFPGDAGKKAFKAIRKRMGNDKPMKFDVVAAPHHSGKLCKGTDKFTQYADCFDWLYKEILDVDHVVVSVGTGSKENGNKHNHPRPAHLEAAVKNGATIICTQITDQCHPKPHSLGLSVLDNCHTHSSCCLGSTENNGVGCAGTVQVDVSPDSVEVHRLDEHQQAIDTKLDPARALCRRFS